MLSQTFKLFSGFGFSAMRCHQKNKKQIFSFFEKNLVNLDLYVFSDRLHRQLKYSALPLVWF
jgi:hypothetical protein